MLVARHCTLKVHFSRMYLARCAQEERPSGDPNTRQQCPPILTHQDIRFRDTGRQGHEATRACHHTLTHKHTQGCMCPITGILYTLQAVWTLMTPKGPTLVWTAIDNLKLLPLHKWFTTNDACKCNNSECMFLILSLWLLFTLLVLFQSYAKLLPMQTQYFHI